MKIPIKLILEARVDDVREKHENNIGKRTFQQLVDGDPSGEHKYLDWMSNEIHRAWVISLKPNNVLPLVKYFHENLHKFQEKDINEYSWLTLEDSIKEVKDTDTKHSLDKSSKSEEGNPWEWTEDIKADLNPGETYYIRSTNGVYWDKETFVGMGDTNSPATGDNIHGYKFKTDHGTGWSSIERIRELIDSGGIREYDPEWTITDELDKSDNLDGIEGRNFGIYFQNGIKMDETIPIQKELAEKGFKFYGKEIGQLGLDDKSIIFIESVDWDSSHPNINTDEDSNHRTDKVLLIKQFDEESNWRRYRDNNERQLQEDLWLLIHHKGILIDGNKLLENLNEKPN